MAQKMDAQSTVIFYLTAAVALRRAGHQEEANAYRREADKISNLLNAR